MTRLLLCAMGSLVALLVAAAGFFALSAWNGYSEAVRVAALTETDRVLFEAIVGIRSQVPRGQTALLTEAEPQAVIEAGRKQAAKLLGDAMTALAASNSPRREELLAGIRRSVDAVAASQHAVDEQAGRPRSARDLRATDPWKDAVFAVAAALSKASEVISNEVRLEDPVLAEMVQVRRTAWVIRDSYGSQCSLLRSNIEASQPLTPRQSAVWHGAVGSYVTAWKGLEELLDRPGVPRELVDDASGAHAATDAAQKRIDGIIEGLTGSGSPAVPSAEWTSLCNGPFEPILAIGYQAIGSALERAAHKRAVALSDLFGAAAGLAVAVVLGIAITIVVDRRLSRPMKVLTEAVARLSHRAFSQPVATLKHPDELGQMAAALESLRQSAEQAEHLQDAADQKRQAELARAQGIEALCRGFESMVAGFADAVDRSTGLLSDTSVSMRQLARQSSEGAASVSAAAEQATTNVQLMAAAMEQLSSSIAEIAARAATSAQQAAQAAQQAGHTHAAMSAMSEAAKRVGDVVQFINGVAAQTNLLALNASIESARAGDAGKGFAVVANEVKQLAVQTAHSTEDIVLQITNIRGTTEKAVEENQAVTRVIGSMDATATAIAAAVEEQGVVTKELSTNVQQAAAGTREVTLAITRVATLSQEAGKAAEDVALAVESVTREQQGLRRAIEDFIRQIQAQ